MTITEGKNFFLKSLKKIYSVEEVSYYYKIIVSEVFERNVSQLALNPNSILKKSECIFLNKAVKDLLVQRPIQYIIRKAFFRSLTLNVNENVLIPRQETEELVNWVIEDFRDNSNKNKMIDIGTGSGCIAISLAKELKNNMIYGLDNDDSILDLAKQNSKNNDVYVNFFRKDINFLNSLNLKIYVIVSNPPYVLKEEKKKHEIKCT